MRVLWVFLPTVCKNVTSMSTNYLGCHEDFRLKLKLTFPSIIYHCSNLLVEIRLVQGLKIWVAIEEIIIYRNDDFGRNYYEQLTQDYKTKSENITRRTTDKIFKMEGEKKLILCFFFHGISFFDANIYLERLS